MSVGPSQSSRGWPCFVPAVVDVGEHPTPSAERATASRGTGVAARRHHNGGAMGPQMAAPLRNVRWGAHNGRSTRKELRLVPCRRRPSKRVGTPR
eukprot:CAMPEP_0180824680 /NCGR_PEP_ID=MMETSP1038_2-20121128/72562_1 /TAXON_ID=632150 /ORGANISM="Azadinium spinosum, Strain 3D9" /LENGTH=94 /DNA_ID=CAMNT_0022867083 /DNA_START=1269 /DNA_END=1549 /DNA_ORIENTATION=-